MRRCPALFAAVFAAALCGCEAGTESLVPLDEPAPRRDPTTTAQSALLFGAVDEQGQIQVMRVFSDGSGIEPFAAPLPGVSAQTHRLEALHYVRGGDRVVVMVGPVEDVGTRLILSAADGDWRVIAREPNASSGRTDGALETSPDLSLVWHRWVFRTDSGWQSEVEVISYDGERRFEVDPLDHAEDITKLIAFAPDSSWFVTEREGRLALHEAEGTLRGSRDNIEPALFNHGFQQGFETSVLLQNNDRSLHWLDLDFVPIEVDGFLPYGQVRVGYQVADGVLSRLEDRRVVPVQTIAPYEYGLVVTESDGRAVIEYPQNDTVLVVGDGGELLFEYGAPEPTLEPNNGSDAIAAYVDVLDWRTSERGFTLLIELHYEAGVDLGRISFEESIEVLSVPFEGTPNTTRIKTDRNPYLPQYVLDADGRALAWIDEDQLFLVDLATKDQRAVGTQWVWPPQHITTR